MPQQVFEGYFAHKTVFTRLFHERSMHLISMCIDESVGHTSLFCYRSCHIQINLTTMVPLKAVPLEPPGNKCLFHEDKNDSFLASTTVQVLLPSVFISTLTTQKQAQFKQTTALLVQSFVSSAGRDVMNARDSSMLSLLFFFGEGMVRPEQLSEQRTFVEGFIICCYLNSTF